MDVRALSIVFPCSASSFLSTQGLMFFLTILIGSVLFGSFSTLFNNRKDEKTSNEALSESSIWNWLFWTSESPTALLFANHISSNWIVQPTISQRQWWQWWNDQEENDNCEEDLYDDQIQALKGLVERQFPSIMNKVRFSRNIDCPTMGCFFAEVIGESVCIRGSSGVELASGLYTYLKEVCNGMTTWIKTGGTQLGNGCLSLEHMRELKGFKLHRKRTVPLSFYQNVVTSSYSMAFWNWMRWEAEIDWMALHGVNFPLALTGQEFIWVQVYREFGIEFEELADYFAGPAFLAWNRMGNLQGYAGPLPWSYIKGQADLQKQIVKRMREFGMTPAFGGFAGFVPRALVRHYPNLSVKESFNWCDFPEEYCCVLLLDPKDPFFENIGSSFIRHQREAYGYDRVGFYSVDVFNEMAPSQSDPDYLKDTSNAVFSAMQKSDASAIWIMQAWLFYSDRSFWKEPQIRAVLSGVPSGHLLLLDLYADRFPQWKRTEAFYGHPFIWCCLHNFGGNLEMHGNMPELAKGLHEAQNAGTDVVGVGMCPEGIEQNPVVYELVSETAFRSDVPDLDLWFRNYALRRYKGINCPSAIEAWTLLRASVYQNTEQRPETVTDIPTSRPGLKSSEVVWGLKPRVWYSLNQVIFAWKALLDCANALRTLSSYQYDLIDVGRQVLSKFATNIWKDIEAAYEAGDVPKLQRSGKQLLSLFDDLDDLLSTHEGFLLAPALHAARSWGTTNEERVLMEKNLKLQITVWGESPSGDTELSDYANKEWSGLVRSFYKERWQRWLDRLQEDLKLNRNYDSEAVVREMMQFTHEWIECDNLDSFASTPKGDPVAISQQLYQKYKDEAWAEE